MQFDNARKYEPHEDPNGHEDGFLHVRTRHGYDYIIPLEGDDLLDGETLLIDMMNNGPFPEFAGATLDAVTRRGAGAELRWTIQPDDHEPFAAACWASGGFYLEPTTV